MPRNGSGTYALPEPPFVPLTTISSASMNSDLSDIGTALTGSLARDGQGGMTAVLPLNTNGFSYTNDPNTGMYRTGSDAQAIKNGGVDIITTSATTVGVQVPLGVNGTVNATGFTIGGNAVTPIGLLSPYAGSVAPPLWLLAYGQTLSRTAYPLLWAFAQAEIALGNTLFTNGDGSTTFTILDMRGNIAYGRDNMGGTPSGRLTSTYYTGNPSLMGSAGGTQSKTLIQSNLPNAALTVSGTFSGSTGQLLVNSGFTGQIASGGAVRQLGDVGTTSASGSITGSTSSLNGGVAQTQVSAISPGLITTWIIYAGQ